jgi:hypothetical protein
MSANRTWILLSLMFLLVGGTFVVMFFHNARLAGHSPQRPAKSPISPFEWHMASGTLKKGQWLACYIELANGSKQLAVLYLSGHRIMNTCTSSPHECVSIDGVDYYPDAKLCRICVKPKHSDIVNECATDVKWKFDMERISEILASLPEDWNTSSSAAEFIRERIVQSAGGP